MDHLRFVRRRRVRDPSGLSSAARAQARAAGRAFDGRAHSLEVRFGSGPGSFGAVELWDLVDDAGLAAAELWCVGGGHTAVAFRPGTAEMLGATERGVFHTLDRDFALRLADAWRAVAESHPEADLNRCDLDSLPG
ncbi:MAG: hypothetical protein AAF447_20410 [Myxococcota bacterium]